MLKRIMAEEDISELIERYLDGELRGTELEQFKSRLLTDPEFAKEVEIQDEVNKIIFENRVIELKDKINKAQVDEGPDFKLGRIVGSVIIITLLAISYFYLNDPDKEITGKKNPVPEIKTSEKAGTKIIQNKDKHTVQQKTNTGILSDTSISSPDSNK
jgi:hypothetical protein